MASKSFGKFGKFVWQGGNNFGGHEDGLTKAAGDCREQFRNEGRFSGGWFQGEIGRFARVAEEWP
jgi:hypothetical protein